MTRKWAGWLDNGVQFLVEGVEIFIFVTLFLLVVVSYLMSMLPGAYSKRWSNQGFTQATPPPIVLKIRRHLSCASTWNPVHVAGSSATSLLFCILSTYVLFLVFLLLLYCWYSRPHIYSDLLFHPISYCYINDLRNPVLCAAMAQPVVSISWVFCCVYPA